jgi:hypothetical protein
LRAEETGRWGGLFPGLCLRRRATTPERIKRLILRAIRLRPGRRGRASGGAVRDGRVFDDVRPAVHPARAENRYVTSPGPVVDGNVGPKVACRGNPVPGPNTWVIYRRIQGLAGGTGRFGGVRIGGRCLVVRGGNGGIYA